MAQNWHDLLFAHWPVPADALRSVVPPQLPVDTFEGKGWLGVVPFHMTGVRPRGVPPLPRLSAFPELNVRTYVTLDGRPGVYFLSLDAGNPVAVWAARMTYFLPYYHAHMAVRRQGERIRYASHRIHKRAPRADLEATYWPIGSASTAERGSLVYWLTERYCLYTVSRRGRVFRCDIDHLPWSLQPADAEIEVNTMVNPNRLTLPPQKPLLHFSRLQQVRIWPIRPR
jgi:uncharacterized protein YqjF (DUF2071 family)